MSHAPPQAKPGRAFERSGDLARGVAFLSFASLRLPTPSAAGESSAGEGQPAASFPPQRSPRAPDTPGAQSAPGPPNSSDPAALGEDTAQDGPTGCARQVRFGQAGQQARGNIGAVGLTEPPDERINIVYNVDCGLDGLDRLARMKQLRIAYISSNRVSSLAPLAQLPHLEFVDASDNSLQIMPAPSRQASGFRCLSVLYLHRNLFHRASNLDGLAECKHLRVLTLRDNPISRDEYYRPSVFRAVPCLLALDGLCKVPHDYYIMASAADDEALDPDLLALARKAEKYAASGNVNDNKNVPVITVHSNPLHAKEVGLRGKNTKTWTQDQAENEFKISLLRARNPCVQGRELMAGWALKRLLMKCRLSLPARQLDLSINSHAERFRECKNQALSSVHRQWASCNPALNVQRCVRGHLGRKAFFKYRIRIMMPTLVIQRLLFRRRMAREIFNIGLRSQALTSQANRALLDLPLCDDAMLFDSPHRQTGLYFLPNDVARIQLLIQHSARNFPDVMAPVLELSNIVLYDVGASSSLLQLPYFRVVAKRESRQRQLEKSLKTSFLRLGIGKVNCQRILLRRGMSCSSAERRMLLQAHSASYVPSADPVSNHGKQIEDRRRRYLLVVRFPSQHARGLFIRMLASMNKTVVPIRFLLQEVLARMVAACAIQGMVRSWLQRRRFSPPLYRAVFSHRAIRLIQRWWRWIGFRLRMACLTLVRTAVQLNGETAVLYCFAHNMRVRFEESKASIPLFREARYEFDFNELNQVFVHATRPEVSDGAAHSSRGFLPHWLGVFRNSFGRSLSRASSSKCTADGAATDTLMRTTVKHRNVDFPEATTGSPTHLKALLQTGTI